MLWRAGVFVLVSIISLPLAANAGDRPAKELFGYTLGPAPLKARAIGFYTKGCLAGGVQLPVNGEAWQAMRISRNRNWGHPELIRFVEDFAKEAKAKDGWPGLLVGDLSQPRGGPMGPIRSGHRSHQVGLDVDIWYKPMPSKKLSRRDRELLSATPLAGYRDTKVIRKNWSKGYVKLLKRAASYNQVERVLVHPAVKKELCETVKSDRSWLRKVRPIYGHNYHFHVRIGCPKGSRGCRAQKAPPKDDGCGKPLTWWLKRVSTPPKRVKPSKKPRKKWKPKPPLTLAGLPSACTAVINAGRNEKASLAYGVSGEIVMPVRNPRRKGVKKAQAQVRPVSPNAQ